MSLGSFYGMSDKEWEKKMEKVIAEIAEKCIQFDYDNDVFQTAVEAEIEKRSHDTGCTAEGPASACDYCGSQSRKEVFDGKPTC